MPQDVSGFRFHRHCALSLLAYLLLDATPGALRAQVVDPLAQAEIAALAAKVPAFHVVALPHGAASLTLTTNDSYTIEHLRGVALDDTPPLFQSPPPTNSYAPNMSDGLTDSQRPYIAQGILPFRLHGFTNEFSFGGWHNFNMYDYAMTHGFNVLWPYNSKPTQWSHLPAGTQFMNWITALNWDAWLPAHGLAAGRYDLLLDWPASHGGETLVQHLFAEPTFSNTMANSYANLMIDLEHALLDEASLRAQSWYPTSGTTPEKAAFEQKYYDGFAQTHISAAQAALRHGWTNISFYGWSPFPSMWWGLAETPAVTSFWQWARFGRNIYREPTVQLMNPSVYAYYGQTPADFQSPAYTLAMIDKQFDMLRQETEPKRIRPYYWPCWHGGSGTPPWIWAAGQPQINENLRAEMALGFFTGVDGLVLWDWSDVLNRHVPPNFAFNTHPTGWWKLDETKGATAADSSGNGYAGTLIGAPARNGGSLWANFGESLRFNGSSQHVNLGSPSGLDIAGAITLSAWIRCTNASSYAGTRVILGHGSNAFLRIRDGYYEVGSRVGSNEYICRAPAPTNASGGYSEVNTWIHLLGRYDGTKWRLFKDSTDVTPADQPSTAYGAPSAAGVPWSIGAYGGGSGGFFAGAIDDARIWSYALDSSMVCVPSYQTGADVMVKTNFTLLPDGGGSATAFKRYQPLRVIDVNLPAGTLTFQPLDRSQYSPPYGLTASTPFFTLPIGDLTSGFRALLRPPTETIAAMIEGLALIKPLEYTLRHGAVKIDVPSTNQFTSILPLVRRVKCGRTSVVITYDPKAIDTGVARSVTLTNFDGFAGLNVTFPADQQARIFVLDGTPADTYTWKTNALGNWSVASNWEGGVVPPTDGTADIVLKFTTLHNPWDYYWNSNVDAAWSTNGSVNSITFDAAQRLDLSMDSGSVLHLGAGGLTVLSNPKNAALFSGTLDFSVNQDITLNAGIANYGMNFVSPTNVTVTFKGNPNWAEFSFLYGSSAGFQGHFASAVQSLVQITFNRYADQFNRLGTNTFTHLNTERTSFNLYDEHSTGDAVKTFPTPIYSDCTGQSTKIIYLNFLGALPANCTSYRMNCTAPISTTYLEPPWNGAIQIAGSTDLTRNNKVFFQADSRGIGAVNAAWASPLIRASYGYFVLDHTNAWGTGNGFRYDMGLGNGGRGCALKATSGNHVNARLIYNLPSETAIPDQRVLGLEGTGAVTFAGEIDIVRSASASAITRQHLVAPPEGKVTFSGQLRDDYGGTDYYSPVLIDGGGTVILSGNANSYGGTTTVTNNTLLLVNGTSGAGAGIGALTVVSGSTLGGTGVVRSASTTILSGGALTAGPTNTIGTLTVTNLTLQAGAIYKCDLSTGGADRLRVAGTLTLPSHLTVAVTSVDGKQLQGKSAIVETATPIVIDLAGWTLTAPAPGYSLRLSADARQILLCGPPNLLFIQ